MISSLPAISGAKMGFIVIAIFMPLIALITSLTGGPGGKKK